MYQKAEQAAQQCALDHGVFLSAHKPRTQTQRRVGYQVVRYDREPVNGSMALKILQNAVYEADQRAPAPAIAHRKDDDGQHGDVHGSAVGEVVNREITENLRQRHKNSALTDHFDVFVFHGNVLLNKNTTWRAMRRRNAVWDKTGYRIPTPALPGSGVRDETAIRLISAGMRRHPLQCAFIIACASKIVNKKYVFINDETGPPM